MYQTDHCPGICYWPTSMLEAECKMAKMSIVKWLELEELGFMYMCSLPILQMKMTMAMANIQFNLF